MNQNINSRIEAAKAKLRLAETEKTKAETQLSNAEENRDKIIQSMKEKGVTPETIEARITELSNQVANDLETVEKLIPEVQ